MKIDFEKQYGEETPQICVNCVLDCDSCLYGGNIFILDKAGELIAKKRLHQQAINRYQKSIDEIDQELIELQILADQLKKINS